MGILTSIPDILNLYDYIIHKDNTRIFQGTRILRHTLEVKKRGRKGIYTFFPKDELI